MLLGAAIGIPLRGSAPFSAGPVAAGLAAGLGLAVLGIASMQLRRGPLGELSRQVREIAGVLFARSTSLDRFVIAALAGVAEEALFRGVVQAGLVASVGTAAGLAGASLLFGLAHAVGPAYVVAATAAGAVFGALHLVTGDLGAPILAHALYDLVLLEWLARRDSPKQST